MYVQDWVSERSTESFVLIIQSIDTQSQRVGATVDSEPSVVRDRGSGSTAKGRRGCKSCGA